MPSAGISVVVNAAKTMPAVRLRELRALRGFKTPTSLARKSGVRRRVITEYEAARGILSTEDAVKLADALDVSVDVLLGRGPLPPSNLDEVDVLRLYGYAVGVNLEVAADEGARSVLEVFVHLHSDDPHSIWLEMVETEPPGEKDCKGRMMGLDVGEARRLRAALTRAIERSSKGRLTTNTDCKSCGFSGDALVDFGSQDSPTCPACGSTECVLRVGPPSLFVPRTQNGQPRGVICWR